jgi:WD40 repeat protein
VDRCHDVGLLRLYDSTTGELSKEIATSAGPVRQIAFVAGGEQVAIICGGAPTPIDCAAPSLGPPLREDIARLLASKPAPDFSKLVGEVWDIASGKRTAEHAIEANVSAPLADLVRKASLTVATASDSRLVAGEATNQLLVMREGVVVSRDCETCPTPKMHHRAQEFSGASLRQCVSRAMAKPSPRRARAPLFSNHPVRRIHLASGKEKTIGAHHDTVRSVAVSPDGALIASVSQDTQLQVVTPAGQAVFQGSHPNKLMKVVFSNDGKMLATATAFDGQVYLWSVEERKNSPFPGRTDDGSRWLRSRRKAIGHGRFERAVKVWNVESEH